MRILLLGATGQVGFELRRTLPALGEVIATARDDSADLQLDITDLAQLQDTLDRIAPDVIVNATAYTAVDQAETEARSAMRINGEVPGLLAQWAAQHGALLLHYSTDYVFDGGKDGAYVETDTPNPLGEYGRSKLAGDRAILDSGCDALILRVSWVYGMRGKNFLLTMQRLMAERDTLNIVDDQIGAPTWCGTIAEVSAQLLQQLIADGAKRAQRCGLYHLAPHGHTSWFGFATAIAAASQLDCQLNPIPASQYPTPAKRPSNSRLDTGKLDQAFNVALPDWRAELRRCLETG